MKQPFTTKVPTISELMPIAMRQEFFRRVLGSNGLSLTVVTKHWHLPQVPTK